MIIRKALATLLREAAAAQGVQLTAVHLTEQGGRLMYRLGDDAAVYTPGEAAATRRGVAMIYPNDHQLYIRSMGKAVRVIAIAESVDEANRYCAIHGQASVIAEMGTLVLIADRHDLGEVIGGKR